ncbi:hypothetical protein RBU49_10810 [Clostridium sp. MB40-C1]|uniref:anti-sigma factor family protein n=1 Tax=Clostridium sp. MB40-C1 TaxID=3070996 RepID=UPI0027DFB6BD|nr:DUF4367 domain-containing protein [Clostridium sp. MB40-C1]WMJ79380.1 hypothetical protein RBU49_10810 [Clostridium sp. MB40-C1]
MCYKLEELQEIIDNTYEGDINEALFHIENCPHCRTNFQRLKQQDKFIESALQIDMEIPQRRPINIKTVDFKEKSKRRIFNMSKKTRKWSAVAAGIALCGGLLCMEPVRTKAADFLKTFRMQEITSISINQSDFNEINRIFSEGKGSKNINDIAKINVSSNGKNVDLQSPRSEEDIKKQLGVENVIRPLKGFEYSYISKQPKTTVSIKLDVNKTNDILSYLGEKSKLPKSLHEKTFSLQVGDIVTYDFVEKSSDNKQKKYIGVTKMTEPTVQIPKDIDEKEVIKALFSMKFLPENIKKQFMGIDDLTSVIPIPYDSEHQSKKDIIINGQKAVLIKDKSLNYINLYFKEKDDFYIIDSNLTIDEVLSFVKEMK